MVMVMKTREKIRRYMVGSGDEPSVAWGVDVQPLSYLDTTMQHYCL